MKILINAEPFGFGPSAIAAQIFDILSQDNVLDLQYIGEGLTLDIHEKLGYRKIWDLKQLSEKKISALLKETDLVITAMDQGFAKMASQLGTKVVFVDALSWFWKNPLDYSTFDYYICQKFLIDGPLPKNDKKVGAKSYQTYPIFKKLDVAYESTPEKDSILINFGGAENPLLPIEALAHYAQKLVYAIEKTHPAEVIHIACSKNLAQYLKPYSARSYSYDEMQSLYAHAKLVYATPGLGNILEVAKHKSPCIFLPPANDSQGLQLDILRKQGFISAHLDWSALNEPLDYTKNQIEVLTEIKQRMLSSFEEKALIKITKLIKEYSVKNECLPSLLDKMFEEVGLVTIEAALKDVLNDYKNI